MIPSHLFLPDRQAGLGDNLLLWSAIAAYKRANPCVPLRLSYIPTWSTIVYEFLPGVETNEVGAQPEGSFNLGEPPCLWHFGRAHPGTYEWMGLSWERKRLYYEPHPAAAPVARLFWREAGRRPLRILFQWHGGFWAKRYPHMRELYEAVCRDNPDARIVLLDALGESEITGPNVIRQTPNIHEMLAIVSMADVYIGYDSAPLVAALGSGVPSFAMVAGDPPNHVFLPLEYPATAVINAGHQLGKIPLREAIDNARFVIDHARLNRRENPT